VDESFVAFLQFAFEVSIASEISFLLSFGFCFADEKNQSIIIRFVAFSFINVFYFEPFLFFH